MYVLIILWTSVTSPLFIGVTKSWTVLDDYFFCEIPSYGSMEAAPRQRQRVAEAFLGFRGAWGRIREEEAKEKQWIFTPMSLYLCTKIIEGKNLVVEGISGRVGTDGSVGVTPFRLSPAHQELSQALPLKTAGRTRSSLARRTLDGGLDCKGRLGSRTAGSSVAGHRLAVKPRHVGLKLCLGFLTSLTNPFYHPFPGVAALWFSEWVFNQELEHIEW